MTDDEIDRVLGGDFDLLSVKLFHHVIRCARRDASHSAPWVIDLTGAPVDDPETEKAFVGAVFRSLLTPADNHHRSSEIDRSIQDHTDLSLFDEGGSPP